MTEGVTRAQKQGWATKARSRRELLRDLVFWIGEGFKKGLFNRLTL